MQCLYHLRFRNKEFAATKLPVFQPPNILYLFFISVVLSIYIRMYIRNALKLVFHFFSYEGFARTSLRAISSHNLISNDTRILRARSNVMFVELPTLRKKMSHLPWDTRYDFQVPAFEVC